MASTDTLETNTAFAAKNAATFPILADPDKIASEAYGVLLLGFARRWTFYIDTDGIVRKIDKDVSARKAGEQLAANLETLGFPRAGDAP